jgi:hypothetical protein
MYSRSYTLVLASILLVSLVGLDSHATQRGTGLTFGQPSQKVTCPRTLYQFLTRDIHGHFNG